MAKSKQTNKKITDQVHGKDESPRDEVQARIKLQKDLNEIMGIKKSNPYKVNSEKELNEALSSMNLSDMREMAVSAGIFPSGNRTVLKKKLEKGFSEYSRGGSQDVKTIPMNNSARAPDSKLQKEIDEIWSRK
jgi:hypothetical protein